MNRTRVILFWAVALTVLAVSGVLAVLSVRQARLPPPEAHPELEGASLARPDDLRLELGGAAARTAEPRSLDEDPRPPSAPSAAPFRVSGRIVDVQDRPIPGAALRLRVELDAARDPGLEEALESRSDDDGTFDLSVLVPAACRVRFGASHPGTVEATWSWTSGPEARHVELGDVLLVASARVTCVALAQVGGVLAGRGWTVEADQPSWDLANGRSGYSERRSADPATGHFVFEAVPAGLVSFSLHGGEGSEAGRESVRVEPAGEHFVEITSSLPGLLRDIHVVPRILHFGRAKARELEAIEAEDGFGRRFPARPPGAGPPGRTWHSIQEVPEGEYTVHIRGAAFQPLAITGVRPGDFVTARLVGNVSARIVWTAAGEPVPPSPAVLEVRMQTPERGPLPRRVPGSLVGDSTRFEGLQPGRQEWILHMPGGGTRLLGALELSPQEARTVYVDSDAGDSVAGVVFERTTRRPLGGAWVELVRASTSAAGDGSAWDDEPLTTTTSDPTTGRFHLAGIAAGAYRLRAELGPLLVSEEAQFSASGSGLAHSIDLELEIGGGIVGRVRMAPGTEFDGLRATVAPLSHSRTPNGRVRDPSLRARAAVGVGPDGGFRSVPLPPGPARVQLYMPELLLPSGSGGSFATSGGSLDLGVVDVLPGQWTAHEFDATASSPGSVEVAAHLDGRAAWGHVVELQQDQGTHMNPKAGALVPPSGRVVLAPLQPGEYILTLRPAQASWVWPRAERVVVGPGSRARVAVNVTVETGTLTILHSQGQPAAHEEVRIRAVATPPPTGAEFRADHAGQIRLALPPGRYSLARSLGSGIATRVEFAWPLGSEHARGLELPR